jgi:hypothetical protein
MSYPKTDESFDWEHLMEPGWLTTPLMFIPIGSASELPPPPDTEASALDVNVVPNNFDQPGYVLQLDRTVPDSGDLMLTTALATRKAGSTMAISAEKF